MTTKVWAIAGVLIAVATGAAVDARADEAPAPPAQNATGRALSLNDALSRAESHAPQVALARSAVREAEARRVGAGVLLPVNPRIQVEARPPITGGTLHDLGYAASAEVQFDLGGAPRARIDEANRAVEAAKASAGIDRLEARTAAWTSYVRAKLAEQRVLDMQAAAAIARRVLAASKVRGEAGAAGDIEQTTAETEVAQLDAATLDAKRQQAARLMELREVLDLDASEQLVLSTAVADPPPAPPEERLVARALSARPELAAMRTRITLLEATGERLARETFPRIGVYAGVDAAPVSPIFGQLGLTVDLPFPQRNQGPRARTARERETEERRLDIEGRRVVREVIATRAAYESRRAELKVLNDNGMPAAERTLTLVEAGWRAGRFDVFRVTAAARDVVRVRSARLEALESAWVERIFLDRAAGGVS